MKKLIPFVLPLVGLGVGVAAGLVMKPSETPVQDAAEEEHGAKTDAKEAAHAEETPAAGGHDQPAKAEGAGHGEEIGPEFVKLSNQFVIPLVVDGRVASLVILSLNLEVAAGQSEAVYAREPKLRDAFLQILFDHANAGGFRGAFTDGSNLLYLRRALLEKAHALLGEAISDVLISDIARQDT